MISFDGLYVYHCPPSPSSPSSRNRTITKRRHHVQNATIALGNAAIHLSP